MEYTEDQIDKNRAKLQRHINEGKRDPIDANAVLLEDEDENTVAKSIVDEIIEETESESLTSEDATSRF